MDPEPSRPRAPVDRCGRWRDHARGRHGGWTERGSWRGHGWGGRGSWRGHGWTERGSWRGHGWGGRGSWWPAESGEPRAERRHRLAGPLFIVVIVALIQSGGAFVTAHRAAGQVPVAPLAWIVRLPGGLLLAVAAGALLLCRRFPRTAVVTALIPTVVYFGFGYPYRPGFLALLFTVVVAVSRGYRQFTWLTVGAGYAVFVALALSWASPGQVGVVPVGVWTLVALGFAEAVRIRRAHVAEVAHAHAERRRAEEEQRRARVERQRANEEQTRRQASEERLRIARELHDVIGHHLSLINVQAGVGLHLMADRPEQAQQSLAAIKTASAEALREVRAVLATLHADEAAPRTPAPGLADLDRLVTEATAAGLPVGLETSGKVRPVPPEVERAAYRIVREAFTNVRRHAGAVERVTVTIGYGATALTVTVRDDGSATPDEPGGGAGDTSAETTGDTAADTRPRTGTGSGTGTGSDTGTGTGSGSGEVKGGSGIAGMRERAAALGGTVDAGPLPDGGFEVRATLPLAERKATDT